MIARADLASSIGNQPLEGYPSFFSVLKTTSAFIRLPERDGSNVRRRGRRVIDMRTRKRHQVSLELHVIRWNVVKYCRKTRRSGNDACELACLTMSLLVSSSSAFLPLKRRRRVQTISSFTPFFRFPLRVLVNYHPPASSSVQQKRQEKSHGASSSSPPFYNA